MAGWRRGGPTALCRPEEARSASECYVVPVRPFPTLVLPMRMILVLLAACVAAAAVACSAGGSGGSGSGGDTTTSSAGSGPGGGGSGGATNVGGNIGGGMNTGGGVPLEAEVFGHSADTLYKLDPLTHEVTVVGDFSGCENVIDIAIDKDDNIFGTTYEGLYRINKLTAACTEVSAGTYPNSLSFVPEGTLEPAEEVLVGYLDADYVRINTSTGQISTVAVDAIGQGYISSGDIVSVINGGTYLTIKGGADCTDTDCLVEVNPSTGALVTHWGSLPYDQIFGLAFWGGAAYGFTNGGELFEITFGNGTVGTVPIPFSGAPQDLSFWGAGSTTAAPLVPPT